MDIADRAVELLTARIGTLEFNNAIQQSHIEDLNQQIADLKEVLETTSNALQTKDDQLTEYLAQPVVVAQQAIKDEQNERRSGDREGSGRVIDRPEGNTAAD